MTGEEAPSGRRLVVAPLVVALSVLVAGVLAVVGAVLLSSAGGATVISVGIAAWWVGFNMLVVGLVSGSAWRHRRPIVGGERVDPGLVARAHPLRAGLHGVTLQPADGGPGRKLHGFVSARPGNAARLAERLNELFQPGRASDPVPATPLPPAETDTLALRRGLPLVPAGAPANEQTSEAADTERSPGHSGSDPGASDETLVVPRRARRD